MELRLIRACIAAVLLFCCACLLPLPICAAAGAVINEPVLVRKFPYENAKKTVMAYLTRTNGLKPSFIGYRMVGDNEAEIYYLSLGTYSSITFMLLNTDSGQRWFMMVNKPKPVEWEKHLEQVQD